MDLGLNGKIALVAAASSGLGFATAMELVREGAQDEVGIAQIASFTES